MVNKVWVKKKYRRMGPVLSGIGAAAGGGLGGSIGSSAARAIARLVKGDERTAHDIGGAIGSALGTLGGGVAGMIAPTFKKGGRVKKTGLVLAHKGEFVLPVGVPPTKMQVQKVMKRMRMTKKGKK